MSQSDKFNAVMDRFEQMKRTLPQVLANDCIRFFKQAFQQEGWTDSSLSKWKKRATETKKSSGKPVLIGSGDLRRSVLNSARTVTFDKIQFIVDLPYAVVHNEGGKYTRKGHTRTMSKSRSVTHTGIFTGSKTTQKTHSAGGSHQVKSSVATYPKRKFMGDSKRLREILKKKINLAVKSTFSG